MNHNEGEVRLFKEKQNKQKESTIEKPGFKFLKNRKIIN